MKEHEKIIKHIFFLPIFTLLLLWISGAFFSYLFFNEVKDQILKDKETTVLEFKRKFYKSLVEWEVSSIENLQKSVFTATKKFIKNKVYDAINLIEVYTKNHQNHDSNKTKKELIKILNSIRWDGGRGYYFVYDKKKKILLVHPINKLRGKYVGKFKDAKGRILVELYEKILKDKKEGFAIIYFPLPSNPNKPEKKIVFIKYLPQFDWVIGTGEYPKVIEKKLKKEVLKELKSKKFVVFDFNGKILNGDIVKNKEFYKILKLKQGFFEYEDKDGKNIGYFAPIKHWKWIIGKGFNKSSLTQSIDKLKKDIDEEIKELFIVMMIVMSVVLVLITILSFYVSNQVKEIFKEYTENLEEKIQNAIKEIREKDEMLIHQSKLASMGEMLGAISHQWRQPLNALAINIQLLEDMIEEGVSKEEIVEFIEKNMKTIEFMSKTIDDFRNFFRKDKEKKVFNVKDVVIQIVDMLNAQLKNNGIEVKIIGEGFEIEGYESEFKQVILNLINNAKEAIISRGVKDGEIEIEFKDKKIFVRDNAGGIEEDIILKIFEPYFTTKENGTGIGLYMSKVIIERNMGGKISVRNLDKGAEFIIDFTKSNTTSI